MLPGRPSRYTARMPHDPIRIDVPAPPYALTTRADGWRALHDAEWILTTGHGGFAMGTALGTPRRKYHTLLNAPNTPPVDRVAMVNTLDETLVVGDERVELAGERGADGSIDPESAARFLERFEKTPTRCRWIYRVDGVEVVKELGVGWRRNVFCVRYAVRSESACRLEASPRVTLRDFHGVIEPGGAARVAFDAEAGGFACRAEGWGARVIADGARFEPGEVEPTTASYDLEASRGLPDVERLLCPGRFVLDAPAGGGSMRIAGALDPEAPDAGLLDAPDGRGEALSVLAGSFAGGSEARAALAPLVAASDDFLVERTVDGRALKTVIAGYPWFADWGRDTMISLPGLMISTGRLDDARACLETFARHVSRGMIPNRFDDYGGDPHYNTVDASFWFLHAARELLDASGEADAIDGPILDACHEIIERTVEGTRYGIRVDPDDGLVSAGDETTQLTWMDAKRDGVVFTPRHGKAVEINALWRHGLVSIAEAIEDRDGARAARCRALAARVDESFLPRFADPETGGLYDCLRPDPAGGGETPSPDVRPNQVFAASLARGPLDRAARAGVVRVVRERLLTPMGLRTLAPGGPNYQARFEGPMMRRDNAYHNGTVWPWLIGHYAEAALRAGDFSAEARAEAAAAIRPLAATLATGCLGQICEVSDGDEPRREEGCVAQAWSVAEVLRIGAMLAG